MNISNKIIDLLKEEKLNILESIEILRDIESAFIEHLKENFNEIEKNYNSQQPEVIACQGGGETNKSFNSTLVKPLETKADEVIGISSRNSPADSLAGTHNKKQPENKVIFLKNSDLFEFAKKLKDSEIHNKTKCKLSINGKCTGNFSPLKCDGLDIPKECLPMMENKSEEKWE